MNITVTSGEDFSGIYAVDGSINVTIAPNPVVSYIGAQHPSGSLYVTYTETDVSSIRALDGFLYVTTAPYVSGAAKVTVISGSLTPEEEPEE